MEMMTLEMVIHFLGENRDIVRDPLTDDEQRAFSDAISAALRGQITKLRKRLGATW